MPNQARKYFPTFSMLLTFLTIKFLYLIIRYVSIQKRIKNLNQADRQNVRLVFESELHAPVFFTRDVGACVYLHEKPPTSITSRRHCFCQLIAIKCLRLSNWRIGFVLCYPCGKMSTHPLSFFHKPLETSDCYQKLSQATASKFSFYAL